MRQRGKEAKRQGGKEAKRKEDKVKELRALPTLR